jgi:hypothetical protein
MMIAMITVYIKETEKNGHLLGHNVAQPVHEPTTWYVGHYLAYCTNPGWWIITSVEKSVEWELAGETEERGENLPHCHFLQHKSHMTWPGVKTGPPRWEAHD